MEQQHYLARPLVRILAGAVLISFSGVWVTWSGVSPSVSAFYRVFFGTIFLLVICLVKKELKPVSPRTLSLVVLCSLCFAADLVCWHTSVLYIGPGLATILANFQVFVLTIASVLYFGLKIRPGFLLSLPLAFLGLLLIVGFQWTGLSDNYQTGIYLGLAAALLYAGFLLSLRKIQEAQAPISSLYGLLLVSGVSSIFLAAQVLLAGDHFRLPHLGSFGALVGLALLSQTIGWAVISNSLPRVVPSIAGLVLLLQPSLSFVWDVVLFERQTSAVQWLGVGVTLAAIYLGMSSSQDGKG
jgi:drug/metabolite transporter (DMT)-like permease